VGDREDGVAFFRQTELQNFSGVDYGCLIFNLNFHTLGQIEFFATI